MDPIVAVLLALSAILAIALAVLLVLRARDRRSVDPMRVGRADAERRRIALELQLAEQTGRLRIVREQHELAVGGLRELASRADGARAAASADPAVAARTAGAIAMAAREVLADLRRAVAVAREGELAAGPAPGVGDLPALFDTMRDAGLGVAVRESGERFEPRPGAGLAIHRILQEALENALQHGGAGTRAVVTLRWTGSGLELGVEDDGIQAAARRGGTADGAAHAADLAALTRTPAGRGITEMRERAELYGGMLTARVRPGVGFSVAAVLPHLRGHNGLDGVRLGVA